MKKILGSTNFNLLIGVSFFTSLFLYSLICIAGEPPFPNELLYPNVISPKYQFGTYGTKLGLFSEPVGACFLEPERLAVLEAGNRRIQIVRPD